MIEDKLLEAIKGTILNLYINPNAERDLMMYELFKEKTKEGSSREQAYRFIADKGCVSPSRAKHIILTIEGRLIDIKLSKKKGLRLCTN